MSADQTSKIYAALVLAQKDARAVEKDGTNNFHKYIYATAEQIIIETKPLLARHGLGVLPTSTHVQVIDGQPYCVHEWDLVHMDGESAPLTTWWPIVPEKGRPLDKAMASADTTSLAYLLRNLLQLPRVEPGTDMDAPERDERNARAGRVVDAKPAKKGALGRSTMDAKVLAQLAEVFERAEQAHDADELSKAFQPCKGMDLSDDEREIVTAVYVGMGNRLNRKPLTFGMDATRIERLRDAQAFSRALRDDPAVADLRRQAGPDNA